MYFYQVYNSRFVNFRFSPILPDSRPILARFSPDFNCYEICSIFCFFRTFFFLIWFFTHDVAAMAKAQPRSISLRARAISSFSPHWHSPAPSHWHSPALSARMTSSLLIARRVAKQRARGLHTNVQPRFIFKVYIGGHSLKKYTCQTKKN